MANTSNSDRWFFTKEQLENTPSRKCGFDAYKELQYRQQAANFIQDIGQRLTVSQLCINTAIVYMHRFYVFHSFTDFHWHQMAAAALFLAAKVEEQPRKLEYVIRVANMCKNRNLDVNSERYAAQSQDLVFNENVLLQTLGFDVAIDHPHTYVVKCCHLVRASKDLAQTSYFMANNSLHLTTMCIQYKPTVVACFCILLACKWSNWEIPLSNEKKEWFTYVDPTVTAELLQQLTSEFLVIFENCPSRLKEKIMAKQESAGNLFDQDSNKKESGSSSSSRSLDEHHKHRSSRPPPPSSESAAPNVGHRSQEQRERDFKERKEKERLAHMTGGGLTTTASSSNNQHNPHHHNPRPQTDPNKMKPHSRPPSNGGSGPFQPSSSSNSQQRNEPRDILRDVAKDSSSSSTSFGIPAVRGGGGGDKDQRSKQQHVSSLLKNNVPQQQQSVDPNNLTNNYRGIVDPNNTRSRSDPLLSKTLSKQEMMRRYEEQKNPHLKTEIDTIKKHLNSTSFDKNNSVYFKSSSSSSSSSTSHKVKSPFNLDNNNKMSVPKVTNIINNGPHSSKPQFNGNNNNNNANGSYDKPSHDHHNNMVDVVKIKTESHLPSSVVKEEIPIPAIIKRPSLFSPDQPPPQQSIHIKSSEPTIIDKFMMSSSASSSLNILSPINSPPSVPSARNRNYSTGSEPELRPTLKKIDQVEGFENLMRDNTIGMTNMPQNSTSINMKIKDEIKTEPYSSSSLSVKADIPSSATTVVNGLETNPILISNLLKEAAAAPSSSHLSGIVSTSSGSASAKIDNVEPATSVLIVSQSVQLQEKEHRHHKSKKNKKEKHKHKDRTNKEENKEKKRKHKDKDREKHSKHKERKEHETSSTSSSSVPLISEPIKIKIQKDKIQPLNQLKIKIPKDKIRTEGIVESMTSHHQQQQPLIGGLKIKIPKDVIANCNPSTSSFSSSFITTSATTNNSSRKRDREKSSSSSATGIPAAKVSKSSHKESKQNGRNSYSKVMIQGVDGSVPILRLTETNKYTKGSS